MRLEQLLVSGDVVAFTARRSSRFDDAVVLQYRLGDEHAREILAETEVTRPGVIDVTPEGRVLFDGCSITGPVGDDTSGALLASVAVIGLLLSARRRPHIAKH